MVGDPGLIVGLVDARRDSGGLVARQRLRHVDLLLGLLARTGSLLGLGKECLDPSLVDEVDGAAEDAGQEEVQENTAQSEVSQLGCASNSVQGVGSTYI